MEMSSHATVFFSALICPINNYALTRFHAVLIDNSIGFSFKVERVLSGLRHSQLSKETCKFQALSHQSH